MFSSGITRLTETFLLGARIVGEEEDGSIRLMAVPSRRRRRVTGERKKFVLLQRSSSVARRRTFIRKHDGLLFVDTEIRRQQQLLTDFTSTTLIVVMSGTTPPWSQARVPFSISSPGLGRMFCGISRYGPRSTPSSKGAAVSMRLRLYGLRSAPVFGSQVKEPPM